MVTRDYRGLRVRLILPDQPARLAGLTAACAVAVGLVLGWASTLIAARPQPAEADSSQATESPAARQSAVQTIPVEKLSEDARAKVAAVLGNVTVFRRLPTRAVACDPDLYLFLVRHPDVVVNVWEALGITQLQLRQTAPGAYRVVEKEGAAATLEFLYQSQDTHIVYSDWSYSGPVLKRAIRGRCLAILKTGYVRESDGRYYITSRLDGFLSVDPGAVEVLTKTLHPLVVKNADANFVQSVGFVGSLSRTAEVNLRGMQRLAGKLNHVQPEARQQFSDLIAQVSQRAGAGQAQAEVSAAEPRLVSRPRSERERK